MGRQEGHKQVCGTDLKYYFKFMQELVAVLFALHQRRQQHPQQESTDVRPHGYTARNFHSDGAKSCQELHDVP